MKFFSNPSAALLVLAGCTCFALAGLEPGDELKITLRGINAAEHERVNGEYQVGEAGTVHLPLLDKPVIAKGLTPEQFARAAEAAYKAEGIYTAPTIEAKALKGGEGANGPTIVSVGGQVKRGGQTQYQKGMTVVQAIDAAGGMNEFASRNLYLIRNKKQYCLDFKNLQHKNIELRPNDSLQVSQKGTLGNLADNWKGKEEAVKELMK
jgi:protein involved in polysaccharide export with SLBB domain